MALCQVQELPQSHYMYMGIYPNNLTNGYFLEDSFIREKNDHKAIVFEVWSLGQSPGGHSEALKNYIQGLRS